MVSSTSKDFQTVYEGEIWCLCTVTFVENISKLNIRPVYSLQIYDLLDSIFQSRNCKAGKEKVTAQVSCYKFSSWKLEKFEWDPLPKLFFFNIQALRAGGEGYWSSSIYILHSNLAHCWIKFCGFLKIPRQLCCACNASNGRPHVSIKLSF